jgi:hypothetical protein
MCSTYRIRYPLPHITTTATSMYHHDLQCINIFSCTSSQPSPFMSYDYSESLKHVPFPRCLSLVEDHGGICFVPKDIPIDPKPNSNSVCVCVCFKGTFILTDPIYSPFPWIDGVTIVIYLLWSYIVSTGQVALFFKRAHVVSVDGLRRYPTDARSVYSMRCYAKSAFLAGTRVFPFISLRYMHIITFRSRCSHLFQKRSGGSWHQVKLYDLGLHLFIGHLSPGVCSSSRSASSSFTIIHTNGLHRVRLHLCTCPGAPDTWAQLMRTQLWPATVTKPQTAATFNVLRQFEKLNKFGHITATDYYRALAHMTDATGLSDLPIRRIYLCPYCTLLMQYNRTVHVNSWP